MMSQKIFFGQLSGFPFRERGTGRRLLSQTKAFVMMFITPQKRYKWTFKSEYSALLPPGRCLRHESDWSPWLAHLAVTAPITRPYLHIYISTYLHAYSTYLLHPPPPLHSLHMGKYPLLVKRGRDFANSQEKFRKTGWQKGKRIKSCQCLTYFVDFALKWLSQFKTPLRHWS